MSLSLSVVFKVRSSLVYNVYVSLKRVPEAIFFDGIDYLNQVMVSM